MNRDSGIIKSGIEGYKIFTGYSNAKTVFIIMSMFAVLGRFYETYKVAVSDILLNLNPEGIIYFSYALALGGLLIATPLYNLIGIGNSFTSIAVILIILCIFNLKRSFNRAVDEVLDISEI
ncbi:hypothetical protein [uncultured Clostridium sp.]|uniref:hypothetical protein n=1 Tax=uncultured Clostridium sp. TaxID=59620 RepID=UPI003216D2F7